MKEDFANAVGGEDLIISITTTTKKSLGKKSQKYFSLKKYPGSVFLPSLDDIKITHVRYVFIYCFPLICKRCVLWFIILKLNQDTFLKVFNCTLH